MEFITSSEAMIDIAYHLLLIFKDLTIVSLFITIAGGACYHVQGDMGCQYTNTLTTQPPLNGKATPHKSNLTILPLIMI